MGWEIHAARKSLLDNTGGSVEFPTSPSRGPTPVTDPCHTRRTPVTPPCTSLRSPHTRPSRHGHSLPGPWREGRVPYPGDSLRVPSLPGASLRGPGPTRATACGAPAFPGRQLSGPGPSPWRNQSWDYSSSAVDLSSAHQDVVDLSSGYRTLRRPPQGERRQDDRASSQRSASADPDGGARAAGPGCIRPSAGRRPLAWDRSRRCGHGASPRSCRRPRRSPPAGGR